METRFFKREELKGKLVITQDAEIIGEMEDFTISEKGKVGFLIKRNDEERIITIEQIKKINDVLLLKETTEEEKEHTEEKPESSVNQNNCPNCGEENRPGTKFCVKCGTELR